MEKKSFKLFLKKYSLLSNHFIEDFYNIYDFDKNNHRDFTIDLEIIAKWLGTKKGKLKETLKNTYKESFDYIIKKKSKKKYQK